MPSHREIDVLVAEKVMGLKPCSDPVGRCEGAKMNPTQCWGDGDGGSDLPAYSEDIAAAWSVVEEMRESEENHTLSLELGPDGRAGAVFSHPCNAMVWSESPSMAICLAALRAVGTTPTAR